MKKSLNIAYLNGAEGMIRKTAASSAVVASTIEYLDISDWENIIHPINGGKLDRMNIIQYSNLSRMELDGEKGITCSAVAAYLGVDDEYIDRIAIDFNAELLFPFEESSTPKKELIAMGITQEELDAIPRITKEEFYSLE